MTSASELPVESALPELREALQRQGRGVLVAPPGAGKTTRVPLVLLEEDWLAGAKILLLEPRRLAARAAATRMASSLGEEEPGESVGYRVRMDTRVGPRTRIEVVTEGVLTRMIQSDPELEGVGLVVFDEFHERSIHADLGLALTLQCRELFRSDLRLLVMSATLDTAPVAELLGGAPVITAEGREYPVETRYLDTSPEGWIEPVVARAVQRALRDDSGDVLAFLPGEGEIRRTRDRLEQLELPEGVDVIPLFGRLSREEQDRAIAPAPPGRRKVVLATSIAETSLTIEGVRVVVDSGRMRIPRFDPASGMTRLDTVTVTRDVADQRRGRAGRTAPGVCYRLWTAGADRGLIPHRRPEILEADLAPLCLELAAWGAEPGELRWLDPPPDGGLEQARELLVWLEALDRDGGITDHGRRMAGMGLHPRLAHMILRAREEGRAPLACDIAALLGRRDVLRARDTAADTDLRARVEALYRARGSGPFPRTVAGADVHRGRLHRALQESRHWRRKAGVGAGGGPGSVEETGRLLALAYPDRVGRRRDGRAGRFLLRNGRGASVREDQILAGAEWIVAASVHESGSEARIFQAAPLGEQDVEELFGDQIETVERVDWDPEADRVRARRERRLGAIVLAETAMPEPSPERVAEVLIAAIRDRGLEVLPWGRETRQLRERLQFLHLADPDAWPDFSEEALEDSLEEWLGPFLGGIEGLSGLQRVDLSQTLLQRLGWEHRGRLDELAPTHVRVPSGSRIRVDYSDPEAPALAVRIQEIFGWKRTPRIGGGRVPLTLRLLSPAQRPVQVTTDLASFWKRAYFDVKKDLMGRYPKHHWPEDPLTAKPTRGLKPR